MSILLYHKRLLFQEYYKQCIRSPIQLQKKTMHSLSTIKRYLKKMKKTAVIKDKRRSVRPCVFRGKKLNSLMTTIRHNRTLSCENLATKYNCNEKTVINTLKKRNFQKAK